MIVEYIASNINSLEEQAMLVAKYPFTLVSKQLQQ